MMNLKQSKINVRYQLIILQTYTGWHNQNFKNRRQICEKEKSVNTFE